jgi:hypothetical protein
LGQKLTVRGRHAGGAAKARLTAELQRSAEGVLSIRIEDEAQADFWIDIDLPAEALLAGDGLRVPLRTWTGDGREDEQASALVSSSDGRGIELTLPTPGGPADEISANLFIERRRTCWTVVCGGVNQGTCAILYFTDGGQVYCDRRPALPCWPEVLPPR